MLSFTMRAKTVAVALLLFALSLSAQQRVRGDIDPGVSGTLGASNAAVTANVDALISIATFTVATSGLSSATVAFEGSTDNSTWFPTIGFRADTGAQALTVANPAANIGWIIPCGGYRAVRVRVSAYTSGSATGNLRLGNSLPPWVESTAATAATVPAKAQYVGANGSGNLTGAITCDNWTPISIVTAVSTKVIALASAKNTYICSFHLFSAGTQNIAWISGTKTTTECDTGTAGLAGGTTATTGYQFTAQTGIAATGALSPIIRTAATGKDVCLISSAAVQISGVVNWTQF